MDSFDLSALLSGTFELLPSQPCRAYLKVTLEDVVKGSETDLTFNRLDVCERCSGNGAKPGTPLAKPCPTCGGDGRILKKRATLLGWAAYSDKCRACAGRGKQVKIPCSDCAGGGWLTRSYTATLNIPIGVQEGMQLRLAGEGNASTKSEQRGDAYLVIQIQQHPFFKRDGDNLVAQADVNADILKHGGKISVATIDGNIGLDIPPNTKVGEMFRLSHKGLPHLTEDGSISDRGDQLIYVRTQSISLLQKIRRLF